MGPWETEVFLAPIAAYCTSHHLHKGQSWSVPSAVDFPARELWPASHCPLEGDGGATRRICPRLWAAALHAGTQLLPSDPPLTQLCPQRVDGELRYRNSQRNGVGIVYSLITLNKEGPLIGSRPYCLARLGFWEPAEWGACDASR